MMKDGEAGARHLASNKYVHRYNEGPAEKLDGLLQEYSVQENNGVDAQMKRWIQGITRANSKYGQIFHHAETREYLKALNEFRPHFNVDTYFSASFCMERLHAVNGAVRILS
jgi:hypothetical protein